MTHKIYGIILLFAGICFGNINITYGQSKLLITVKDSISKEVLPGAVARISSNGAGNSADTNGIIRIEGIPAGKQIITISMIGYLSKELTITSPFPEKINVFLSPSETELDEVVVTVTRTNSRMDETPVKVEVLGYDEMNEENAIKPGNVASLLGDISGIQIQQSSAVSGNSNVRIQGLDGRYTQILRDGLPLYEGFSGGFGIMQVPPLDLKQIEIIKGSSSTLYGGGAISGIINFVSQTPGEKAVNRITLNQSSLMESNINSYCSSRKGNNGLSVFSGFTRQSARDVDKDGFSDVPQLYSLSIHPRYFLDIGKSGKFNVGLSTLYEERIGGDMEVIRHNQDSAHSFYQETKAGRYTLDFNYTLSSANNNRLSIRGSGSIYELQQKSSNGPFAGSETNLFFEASYLIPRNHNDFIIGINYIGDLFFPDVKSGLLFGKELFHTPGIFIQDTYKWKSKFFLESGLRTDYNNKYGIFVLPRIAGLFKFNRNWYMRIGGGMGYKNPDILSTGNEDINPYLLIPVDNGVKPEHSAGGNLEINYSGIFSDKATLTINQAFFYTTIFNPILITTDSSGYVGHINAKGRAATMGSDTYIRLSAGRWEAYLGYTYTYAQLKDHDSTSNITYTPRHRAAATLVYEIPENWRFGLEGSYNGRQFRDNGFRTPDYFFLAAMIEKKFKNVSLVLNGENLLDFRQTRTEAIISGNIHNPTFSTLWAPNDGRVINFSIVLNL